MFHQVITVSTEVQFPVEKDLHETPGKSMPAAFLGRSPGERTKNLAIVES
jgi:hypothetical protein